MSGLLGYPDYASVSTAEKMAQSPDAVERMTVELREKAFPAAVKDLEELRAFSVRTPCSSSVPATSQCTSVDGVRLSDLVPYNLKTCLAIGVPE